jgi:hypothetical protein
LERPNTIGRVLAASRVESERPITNGRVQLAGGVAKERQLTNGRVVEALVYTEGIIT